MLPPDPEWRFDPPESGATSSPVAFVGMFWGIFHPDARLRGWDDLAERFAARVEAPRSLSTSQDGSVGRVGMIQTRKMLRAAATSDALYLAMPSWVVAAHPPLLIRWSELRVVSCRYGITKEVLPDLEAGKPAVGRIFLRGGVAASVLEKLDPASSACETER